MGRFGRINDLLCRGGRRFASVLLAAIATLVLASVIFRYGFNASLRWSEELAKTLMVWSAFAIAPWAYRSGAHARLDFFENALPLRFRAALNTILHGLVLLVLGFLLVESLHFVVRGIDNKAASLPVSVALFYAILPPSLLLMMSVGLERLLREAAIALGREKG